MPSTIKTILISSVVSFLVATGAFIGLSNLDIEAGKFLPERVIVKEKEIVKEPQVVEKYIPQTTEEEMVVKIVKESQESVVSVIATKDLPVLETYYADPFREFGFPGDFFGGGLQIPQYRQKGTEKKEVSSGSGFIVSADGLVLTNKHVVSEEEAEFTVVMNDGKKYPAKVLAKDPVQDIAVLKIEAKSLSALKLGNSDNIQIGQTVVAIGNALGEFENTVSKGVV